MWEGGLPSLGRRVLVGREDVRDGRVSKVGKIVKSGSRPRDGTFVSFAI